MSLLPPSPLLCQPSQPGPWECSCPIPSPAPLLPINSTSRGGADRPGPSGSHQHFLGPTLADQPRRHVSPSHRSLGSRSHGPQGRGGSGAAAPGSPTPHAPPLHSPPFQRAVPLSGLPVGPGLLCGRPGWASASLRPGSESGAALPLAQELHPPRTALCRGSR